MPSNTQHGGELGSGSGRAGRRRTCEYLSDLSFSELEGFAAVMQGDPLKSLDENNKRTELKISELSSKLRHKNEVVYRLELFMEGFGSRPAEFCVLHGRMNQLLVADVFMLLCRMIKASVDTMTSWGSIENLNTDPKGYLHILTSLYKRLFDPKNESANFADHKSFKGNKKFRLLSTTTCPGCILTAVVTYRPSIIALYLFCLHRYRRDPNTSFTSNGAQLQRLLRLWMRGDYDEGRGHARDVVDRMSPQIWLNAQYADLVAKPKAKSFFSRKKGFVFKYGAKYAVANGLPPCGELHRLTFNGGKPVVASYITPGPVMREMTMQREAAARKVWLAPDARGPDRLLVHCTEPRQCGESQALEMDASRNQQIVPPLDGTGQGGRIHLLQGRHELPENQAQQNSRYPGQWTIK